MVIASVLLALLILSLALPNYLAIRYALFGGAEVAAKVPVDTAVQAQPPAESKAPAAPRFRFGWRRKAKVVDTTRGIYMWKALSPMLFTFCFILGIGIGGPIGIGLVAAAFLYLLWGVTGWGSTAR